MKITLVITNPSGKNLAFLTDSLHVLSLTEAIGKAKATSLNNLFVVNGTYGEYLRAIPNSSEKDNLDSLSVTAADIMAFANRTRHFQSTDAISLYAAPKTNPVSIKRGDQIAMEFYTLAKKWLK